MLKALPSALVQTPRGPPFPRQTGAGLDQGVCVLGDELGPRAPCCYDVFSGVLGWFLALHRLSLPHGWALTWVRDYWQTQTFALLRLMPLQLPH